MSAPDQTFRAGLVQLRSGVTVAPNVEAAERGIRKAAAGGAQYVQTPENTALMELDTGKVLAAIQYEEGNAALAHFSGLARELGLWLHIGATPVRVSETLVANRSYLFAPDGTQVAHYDKVHMFDVELPGGETYRESRHYRPGTEAVIAETPWGRLGMTVCYDLRFAYLYRALAQAGARYLAVPSAFTRQTGLAHWRVLLRARAIETGCFVFAAAQAGDHEVGRATYGHAMIVNPWGEVLAEAGADPCVLFADIDPSEVAVARQRIPALTHDRSVNVVFAGTGQPVGS